MHSPIPGSELTKEPFRWDQRLFSLVLRLSGTPAVERDIGLVASDASPIDAMCEVTGGKRNVACNFTDLRTANSFTFFLEHSRVKAYVIEGSR